MTCCALGSQRETFANCYLFWRGVEWGAASSLKAPAHSHFPVSSEQGEMSFKRAQDDRRLPAWDACLGSCSCVHGPVISEGGAWVGQGVALLLGGTQIAQEVLGGDQGRAAVTCDPHLPGEVAVLLQLFSGL